MYSVKENGITKKLETWNLIIPLHDNNGNRFSQERIDEILDYISLNYPGFTVVNCIGFWKDQQQTYRDDNYQIIIDTILSNNDESTHFFNNLKSELAIQLEQKKIYITKTSDKEEFLSFNEFFDEIGLEVNLSLKTGEEKYNLAKKIVSNHDFILKRLGYETVVLQRDPIQNKIIWERIICGLRLKSEFRDSYSKEAILIAADQIDSLGEALFGSKLIILIGSYEYQKFILEKIAYKPLVKAELGDIEDQISFLDQQGIPITTKKFIELFSMTVFCNYMILREENYLLEEIKINVGSDGSMQMGESKTNGNCLMHCPATIQDKSIQLEIIRCINEAVKLFETNELDPVALLQTKARNNYINNRAIIRRQIKLNKA